jgi:CubicO group peptidase (beta-lactamase class C family)
MKTFCAALALVLVATTSGAQDAARLADVVQAKVHDKTFMGAVLVARGPEIVLSKGYGFANLEWDVANTPSTKFRIGSLTKQFTAAAILLLEERGKLQIDDPVKKHIPDAPAAWDAITIHNLLTHTSGIPNFTSLPEYKTMQPLPSPIAQTVAAFRDKPLDFVPGARMAYSNSGYLVLGSIIEKISSVTYPAFLQENILTPLGLKDTGYDSNTAIIPRRASGYVASPNGPVHAGFLHMTIPHAAGGLYSTTEDLLRWQQALFGGKVLSAASLQKMLTPFKNNYALGLGVRTANGRKVIEHNGGINGFNSALSYYPDSRVTVVVLANINGPAADQLAARLGAVAHGDAVQPASERALRK